MPNETTSVIALALSFGFAFLGVLQWVTNLIKSNNVELKTIQKELQTVKLFNVDIQTELGAKKLELNELTIKYERLASAAKRLKDRLELLEGLVTPETHRLTSSEITNIELEVSVEAQVTKDISSAK